MPDFDPGHRPARRGWITLFVFIALVILAGGYGYYRTEVADVREKKYQAIASIAELKVAQIGQWRRERLADVRRPVESPFFRRAMGEWKRSGFGPERQTEWRERLNLERAAGFADALLLDPAGSVLVAATDRPDPVGPATARAVKVALDAREPALSEFFRATDGAILVDAAAPALDADGTPLAVLVQRSDVQAQLHPLIQLWPTPSASAETLLVCRQGEEVVFLNELRHRSGTALSLRIPLTRSDSPAVQAVLGRQGRFEGRDYRGLPVLADLRLIPGTPWFMVAKIDTEEVLSEARHRAAFIGTIVASLILLAAAATAYAYRRRQAGLYRNLYKAERMEREARDVFRTTLYSIGDAVITTDAVGHVAMVNPVAETLTGWKDAEARGRPLDEVFRIVNEETRRGVESPVARVLREGKVVGLANHTVLLARDGSERPIADSGAPIRDESGAIVGVVLVFRDQTEERAKARELREQMERLETAGAHAHLGSWEYVVAGQRGWWSSEMFRLLNCDPARGIPGIDDYFERIHPEDRARVRDALAHMASGEEPVPGEFRSNPAHGPVRHFSPTFRCERDAAGTVVKFTGTLLDITARKESEHALRESEARYRTLFENNHTVMLVVDPDSGAIVDANPAATTFYGWSRDELVRKAIAEINTLTPDQIRAEMHAARAESRNCFLFRHRRADGTVRDVEVYSSPVGIGGHTLLYSIVLDVTDRHRAEERIRRLNRTLAVLSDINQAIVRERDMTILHRDACRIAVEKGGFLMAWIGLLDPATRRVEPVAHAGATGTYLETIDIAIDAEERSGGPTGLAVRAGEHAVCNDIEQDPRMPPWREEALRLGFRASASFPLKIRGRTVGAFNLYSGEAGFFDDEELNLLDELAMDVSFALEHADAEAGRRQAEEWAQRLSAFPELNPNPVLEFDADGALTYFNAAAQAMVAATHAADLTLILPAETRQIVASCLATGQPRLRVETRHGSRTLSWSFYPIPGPRLVHCYAGDITDRLFLEEQLRQAQKLDAIGRLAGGVAHDFNNLLTVIHGNSSLLLADDSARPEMVEAAREIREAAARAANLTRQLLTFSRRQPIKTETVDLNDVVSGVGRMLQRLIGEDIVLHTSLLPGGAPVKADAGMLEQVLLNLAVNARDAMPRGGEVRIGLDSVSFDPAGASRSAGARPGSFIRLTVRDNGSGIDPDHLSHIFEPFFTTKEIGKGTGLGLATVHGIVAQHQGWIAVESQPGSGATFIIHLPRLEQAEASRVHEPETVAMPGGSETILVVEDEPAVRTLAVRILSTRGYRVLAAPSGAAALEMWPEHSAVVDLLLTDLVMPGGVSGPQLAERLRAEKPELTVIYMSGYAGDTAGRGLDLREGVNFLQKPFSPSQLVQAVRQSLDQK
jgi:two-component system, cell cycle sensor histidine kinase and response regulator CckA